MGIWAVPITCWVICLSWLTFSISVLVLKKKCLSQAAGPEIEVHQDTCVNAIAALLCLLYIQVTSLWSCLFLAITNAFQQLCFVQTSVYVQTSDYMTEGKKSTRARSLPLVSLFNPLPKLELKAD